MAPPRRRDARGRYVSERTGVHVVETTRLLDAPRVAGPEVERHEAGCPRGDALRAYAAAGKRCTYLNARTPSNPACSCTPLRHAWHRPPRMSWPCCERCGVVRPADGRADAGPCRGFVRVCVRQPEPAAAP